MRFLVRGLALLLCLNVKLQAQVATPVKPVQSPSTIQTGNIKTNGACSPVLVAPAKPITIECNTVGLTEEEIAKERQQYADILSGVRQSGLKEDQILQLEQEIANSVNRISEASKRRAITEGQRAQLVKELSSVSDTNLLIFTGPGGDDAFLSADFLKLFHDDLHWKSAHQLFGMVPSTDEGVYLFVTESDLVAKTIPAGCEKAATLLLQMKLIDQAQFLKPTQNMYPAPGTCTIYVAPKKIAP
jgi:hypothetical protein